MQHEYSTVVKWTGNLGQGTADYKAYKRDFSVLAEGKSEILGSSDPSSLGDNVRHNPEDLLLSSLAACHMLWYLHLCAVNQIVVTTYVDNATGVMVVEGRGDGRFTEAILNPVVEITDATKLELAKELHHKAHQKCYIANSVNFEVKVIPIITAK